jgi:hypothetical protein
VVERYQSAEEFSKLSSGILEMQLHAYAERTQHTQHEIR